MHPTLPLQPASTCNRASLAASKLPLPAAYARLSPLASGPPYAPTALTLAHSTALTLTLTMLPGDGLPRLAQQCRAGAPAEKHQCECQRPRTLRDSSLSLPHARVHRKAIMSTCTARVGAIRNGPKNDRSQHQPHSSLARTRAVLSPPHRLPTMRERLPPLARRPVHTSAYSHTP